MRGPNLPLSFFSHPTTPGLAPVATSPLLLSLTAATRLIEDASEVSR